MNPRRLGWRVAVVMALGVAPGAARAEEPPYTVADVKRAWKGRQEAHKSFRVEWVETVKVKAGGYNSLGSREAPGPHPPEDTELKNVRSFAADGDKAATANEQAAYDSARKAFLPYSHSARFDGARSMRVSSASQPGWGRVNVIVGKNQLGSGLHSTTNIPIQRVYRPMGGGAFPAFDFDLYKFTGRTEKIRGAECVEIDLKEPAPGVRYSIWCDPRRDFLPIRLNQRYRGGGMDIDWEYRKDDKGRWVPTGWESKQLGGDIPIRYAVKAEVKKLDLAPEFAAGAFAPKPPPSSHVSVFEDNELKEEYLVRPDGSKRALKPSERSKSFDDLAKTNADDTPYVPLKK